MQAQEAVLFDIWLQRSQEGLLDPERGGSGQATFAIPWKQQGTGNSGPVEPGTGGVSHVHHLPAGRSWQAVDPR